MNNLIKKILVEIKQNEIDIDINTLESIQYGGKKDLHRDKKDKKSIIYLKTHAKQIKKLKLKKETEKNLMILGILNYQLAFSNNNKINYTKNIIKQQLGIHGFNSVISQDTTKDQNIDHKTTNVQVDEEDYDGEGDYEEGEGDYEEGEGGEEEEEAAASAKTLAQIVASAKTLAQIVAAAEAAKTSAEAAAVAATEAAAKTSDLAEDLAASAAATYAAEVAAAAAYVATAAATAAAVAASAAATQYKSIYNYAYRVAVIFKAASTSRTVANGAVLAVEAARTANELLAVEVSHNLSQFNILPKFQDQYKAAVASVNRAVIASVNAYDAASSYAIKTVTAYEDAVTVLINNQHYDIDQEVYHNILRSKNKAISAYNAVSLAIGESRNASSYAHIAAVSTEAATEAAASRANNAATEAVASASVAAEAVASASVAAEAEATASVAALLALEAADTFTFV
jgi:hypothetical protein